MNEELYPGTVRKRLKTAEKVLVRNVLIVFENNTSFLEFSTLGLSNLIFMG